MNHRRSGKIPPVILIILGLMIALPISGAVWFIVEFNHSVNPTTRLNRYAEAISPMELEPEQSAIFPTVIPPQATNIIFYYRPHFLQGNAMVQLRFNAGDSFETMHRHLTSTLPPSSGPSTQQSNFPVQIRTADNKSFEDLPADFEVWYYMESSGAGGHDTYQAMIAGSATRREIVYVAQ